MSKKQHADSSFAKLDIHCTLPSGRRTAMPLQLPTKRLVKKIQNKTSPISQQLQKSIHLNLLQSTSKIYSTLRTTTRVPLFWQFCSNCLSDRSVWSTKAHVILHCCFLNRVPGRTEAQCLVLSLLCRLGSLLNTFWKEAWKQNCRWKYLHFLGHGKVLKKWQKGKEYFRHP